MANNKAKQAPPIIVRETFPNTDIREYHVNFKVAERDPHKVMGFKGPLDDADKKYLEQVGPIGTVLIMGLIPVDGIDNVDIEPFALRVERAKAFRWDELEPSIFNALANAAGVKRVKIQSRTDFQDAEIPLFSRFLRWIQWSVRT